MNPSESRITGQMLLAILESASQAILGTGRDGRILLANARAEEMFGYGHGELAGAPIETLLPEQSRAAHERHRADYFENPRVRPMGIGMELAGRRKDGAEFPVEISLSYVKSSHEVFAIAFVTDISLRKQLEEQLLHARKMEAVGRLAGGVAHDFNNMLTIIAGYNRMILDSLAPADRLRGYAEEILKASDRAAALTRQLLSFSRRQVMKPRVFDVNALVADIEGMLRKLIGEDIELRISPSPVPAGIRADPGHVTQAIVNLAANARDAMPGGGRLTLETANLRLDESYARTHLGVEPGQYVMIAMSDTGHGMDAETRRHIFEPFFTTKKDGLGTGLGLATVYGMVKQAGGDVWVYSEPGKGTVVKLYFPAVLAAAAADGPAPRAAPARGVGTLLAVEDEVAVRKVLAEMLSQAGYTVLAASSGKEALEISGGHEGAIDLLVTDVVMPGMSGPQLAAALSLIRPAMRVLYLSGYAENAVFHHGVLDGGAHYLAKPFTEADLTGKIREILELAAR